MKKYKRNHRSWVMRLPQGLRDQPAWIFTGTLVALVGLSYLFGISTSAIAQVVDQEWLRMWGGFLFISGVMVVIATITINRALERLSLRFLSLGFLVYIGWVLAVIPLTRATVTVAIAIALVVLSEIRVAVLKVVLKPLPASATRETV